MGTITELRDELAPLRGHSRVGLVATMGAFHAGHLSLMHHAREECDVLVVSLFVNPSQFDDPRDLAAYPNDETRDGELAATAGVDLLFAPRVEEMYPAGFATTVTVSGITTGLEGERRGRSHFDGVATVVTKLFNIVAPDVAYFGQKDAQQVAVIRRLVRDLDLPVELRVCPTVRDRDGLALSSRNALLSPSERDRAATIPRALQAVRDAVQRGERDAASARAQGLEALAGAGIEPEYLELVDARTFTPVKHVNGDVLTVVAARVGRIRLIDNHPAGAQSGAGDDPSSAQRMPNHA